ncbi:M20/M25/M40 family metallo-hydrolase [Candidatus Aerophobetes bacterium]|nr:M20/M25/M40 family metallo-hydrolase [Candidatus Aerophobetes bacterium]
MREIKNQDLRKRIVKILQKLVETPTPTGNEERLHGFLSSLLKRAGFQIEIQRIPDYPSNLVGKRGKGKLLFCTHIDTYPPFNHPDPYRLTVDGENLIGRGVIDAKGQIASLLVALENTETPCQVALTSGEEEEALGSKFLKVDAREGIVLEPTDLSFALSQAGAIEIQINVEGKAVHGSVPSKGENAILKAFRIYRKLEKMPFLKQTHPHFPHGGWINLGKIEGGKDIMVTPFSCNFQVDIGIIPGIDIDNAVQQIKNVVFNEGGKVNFRDISPPIEINPDLKVINLLRESFEKVLGRQPKIKGMPSWTDAENLFQKGIHCVVFGAGKLFHAHSNYEFIPLKQLEILSRILIYFLNLWRR